jgi:alpha-tubulin suppressor-like RCC1 family protein
MQHLTSLLSGSAALLLAACSDEPTRPGERRAPRAVADANLTSAAPLSFRQVSVGGNHTCGVTTDNVAYCWGFNLHG